MSSIGSRLVSISEFQKVGLTVAKATSVSENLKAKIPAYLLELDFGASLLKEHSNLHNKNRYTSSAQLCTNHRPKEIENQFLMCVLNFPRKQIGPKMSDCLVTGAQNASLNQDEKRNTTVFITPSQPVSPGSKIGLFAEEGSYFTNSRDLTWDEFAKLDLRIGTITSLVLSRKDNEEKKEDETQQATQQIDFEIDLGDSTALGVGLIKDADLASKLVNQQVMVLTNLKPDEIQQSFEGTRATIVLCTVAGRAFLKPALRVGNGYKIA